jgi:hypothetical protein
VSAREPAPNDWLVPLRGWLAVSFLALGAIVVLNPTRWGDLINLHTDHLHHVRATWTFFHRGLDVYRVPFGQIAPTVPYRHDIMTWPAFPIAYPVGMFALFSPPALAGQWLPLTLPALGKLTVLWLLAIAHLAMYAVALTMREQPGARIPLFVGIWLLLMRSSMTGFYDASWIGCAAMSAWALARKRPVASLVWFAAAALLSYRAASALPIAAWASIVLLRSEASLRTKLVTLGGVGAVGLFVVYTFVLMTRHSPPAGSAVYEAAKSTLLPFGLHAQMVLVAAVVVAAMVARPSGWLVAGAVVWSSLIAIYHAGHSWHGTILMIPALAVGASRLSLAPSYTRGVLTVWIFGLWDVFFENPPFVFLRELLAAIDRLR